LVVDDSPDALELAEYVLRSHGATVFTAKRAVEALRIVEKFPPDVLLSDVGLPDMDGYQLLEEIRRLEERRRVTEHEDVHIPAAAITAFTRRADHRKSILVGYRYLIPKPLDADELLKTVASLAGRAGNGSSGDRA
jgi:CheY-like chemotaxis protein